LLTPQHASTVRNRLHDLVAEGLVVKVSTGRTGPLTRNKLAEYR